MYTNLENFKSIGLFSIFPAHPHVFVFKNKYILGSIIWHGRLNSKIGAYDLFVGSKTLVWIIKLLVRMLTFL